MPIARVQCRSTFHQVAPRAHTPKQARHSSPKVATMASKPCCDAGAPVAHEYTKRGSMAPVDDLKQVYFTGSDKAAVIFIGDIFGFNYSQTFQVADRLAEQGFLVAVPDYFEGDEWPLNDFPPSDGNKFMNWVATTANTDKTVEKVKKVQKYLKEQKGCDKFAVVGFCWGGGVALTLASDSAVFANAGIHAAFFGKEKELAEKATNPICLLPTKDDPMEDVQQIMEKKDVASKCFFKRYDDQVHGFLAARGDFKDGQVAKRAGEAIGDLTTFLKGAM